MFEGAKSSTIVEMSLTFGRSRGRLRRRWDERRWLDDAVRGRDRRVRRSRGNAGR
jgi:hypothetical protein